MLPAALCELFNRQVNHTSTFLQTFYHLPPDIALAGIHTPCTYPVAFFFGRSSFKNAQGKIKLAASHQRMTSFDTIACPGLKELLSEIPIASTMVG